MTRARNLSKLSNPAVFTVDTDNNLGINSISPVEKVNVVGVVSATSFFGDGSSLTGVSASELSGTPDVSIRNLTGVAATFTGVVTYEDVTNIDSVGIVTARSGLRVVGGGITVTGISTFFVDGSTQNVQFRNTSDSARVAINMDSSSPRIQFISADNDTAFISGDSNANVILSAGNTLNLRANTSETVLQGDGDTRIFASDVEKLTVNSGGINVSGVVTATSFTGDGSQLSGVGGENDITSSLFI